MSKSALEVLVGRIAQLPSLPPVVHRLIEVTQDPDATMEMVERVIRTDQSLTAKVLQLVNSAFFALSSRVSTVQHAVVILGFDALRNTALAVCTYEYLNGCGRNKQFDKRAFWEHAAAVGILAKRIATAAGSDKPDEAFVAGLLHDLGKVVLDEYFSAEFARALAACRRREIALEKCEEEALGFDHCFAGAAVARKWRFPPQLAEAIGRHHDSAPYDVLSASVMLADATATAWRIGASGDPNLHPISAAVWQHIPLDEAALGRTVEGSRDEIALVRALFYSDLEEAAPARGPREWQESPVEDGGVKRVVLVTTDDAPLVPLKAYLEASGFAVDLARPEQPPPADEVQRLVVLMPDGESAARVKDELVAKWPGLKSVPVSCVAAPFDPGPVVAHLLGTMPARAANKA